MHSRGSSCSTTVWALCQTEALLCALTNVDVLRGHATAAASRWIEQHNPRLDIRQILEQATAVYVITDTGTARGEGRSEIQ